jgi:hypothetical protein
LDSWSLSKSQRIAVAFGGNVTTHDFPKLSCPSSASQHGKGIDLIEGVAIGRIFLACRRHAEIRRTDSRIGIPPQVSLVGLEPPRAANRPPFGVCHSIETKCPLMGLQKLAKHDRENGKILKKEEKITTCRIEKRELCSDNNIDEI